ncbi:MULTISPECIES: GNAT family N-acetyltransferase [Bacillaceae]|uniref:GNAT family acetyltransferase n=1 Tax=Alkalicoccobacillus plakortidis TaxID=444060 RepID=A0A9D5I2D6_9BACI|nr:MULTISPECIES: GNAT family N-acetyltransferase [Bacillaceae]KQL58596.1 GNAT family acetyltransferase [Alkalicoccobacillus plakortidis]RQW22619.1 N-acetyltransferase [Bacillus sp. C1-1]
MNVDVRMNLPIEDEEVPLLRETVGWARRDQDYPLLFERCTFWAGMRGENEELIAFGYLCGMGLEHGYIEDVIVHPSYQGSGIGAKLVKRLLVEAETTGIEIVTVTFDTKHASFYQRCGFTYGGGGVWRIKNG